MEVRMGRLGLLAEEMLRVARADAQERKDAVYQDAQRFLQDGSLPNGSRWRDGAPAWAVVLGGADTCALTRLRQEVANVPIANSETLGMVRYSARFRVAPVRSNGAGIGIDGSAVGAFTAQSQDMPGDRLRALRQLASAMHARAVDQAANLAVQVSSALRDDLVWRIVGWNQRDQWERVDYRVEQFRPEAPLAEARHGKTLSIWIPFAMDVLATLRRKA